MNQVSRWLVAVALVLVAAGVLVWTGKRRDATKISDAPADSSQTQSASEDGPSKQTTPVLTIGSKAPALNIEHWVLNGQGKFKPVTEFENGKVYVIEFWATWCGPCIETMPHIAELQAKYADQPVQIVSISDEHIDDVNDFLKKEFGPDQSKTYRDITQGYCLTTDPDGSSNRDYLEACELEGIPIAFIVGKNQQIEWIGRPIQMDEPLAQVVADKWDRTAFAELYKEARQAEKLMENVTSKIRSGDIDASLRLLDDYLSSSKNEDAKRDVQVLKFEILVQSGKNDPLTLSTAKEIFAQSEQDIPMINMISWKIYEAASSGKIQNKDLVRLARSTAEKSIPNVSEAYLSNLLDTVSHLEFLDGDLDKAIETHKMAIAKASSDSEREQLSEFLKELEAAAAKASTK